MVRLRTASKIFFVAICLIWSISPMNEVGAASVKLAFIAPVSGPNASQGMGLTNAFDLAIKEANKSGKFPYKIEMMGLDDASDPAVAFSAGMKAVSDKGVVAGAGHWNSSCALATIHGFHAYKVPFIVCAAVSPKITEFNYPEITRTHPILIQENTPLIEWIMGEIGYKTFSIVADTTDYGQTGARDWENQVKKRGGKILSVDYFPVGTTDFRPILTKIKGLNPDCIYASVVVMEGALIRSQMVKLGLDMGLTAIDGLCDDKFNEVAGAQAEGTLITGPGVDLEDLGRGPAFIKAYENQKYREPMGATGIFAYESANIILEALKQVGPKDKVALAKAIRSIKYSGILGTTTFDENGQTTLGTVRLLVSQDGKWVKWNQSKYKKGERKLPKPKQ